MSIEKTLERIAVALEALAKKPEEPIQKVMTEKPAKKKMTESQLQSALVDEFNRLGGRGPIDEVFAEFNISGIKELDPSKYEELLEKVKSK